MFLREFLNQKYLSKWGVSDNEIKNLYLIHYIGKKLNKCLEGILCIKVGDYVKRDIYIY